MAKIGELLISGGHLTQEGLEEAIDWQVLYGGRLGTNLLELKLVEEEPLAHALGRQLGAEVAWGELAVDPALVGVIPKHVADRQEIVPWKFEKRRLKVLCCQIDVEQFDRLSAKLGRACVPVVAPEFRIFQLLRAHYHATRQMRALDFGVVPEEGRSQRRKTKEKGQALEEAPELIDESAFNDIYAQVLGGRAASPPPTGAQPSMQPGTWPGFAGPFPGAPPPAEPAATPAATPPPAVQPPPPAPSTGAQPPAVPPPPQAESAIRPAAQPASSWQPQYRPPSPPVLVPQPPASPLPQQEAKVPAPAAEESIEALPDDAILEELPADAILEMPLPGEPPADAAAEALPLRKVSWDDVPHVSERPRREEAPLGFKEALQALEGVTDRDSIAHIVLRASRSKAARALLLQVQGGVAIGWDGLGEGLEHAGTVAIPLSAESAFSLVVKTRSHYMGPLHKTPQNIRFLAMLGKKVPLSALLFPILHKGRVSHMLYLDNGHKQQAPTDVGEMLILSQRISQTVEALVARKRKAARG